MTVITILGSSPHHHSLFLMLLRSVFQLFCVVILHKAVNLPQCGFPFWTPRSNWEETFNGLPSKVCLHAVIWSLISLSMHFVVGGLINPQCLPTRKEEKFWNWDFYLFIFNLFKVERMHLNLNLLCISYAAQSDSLLQKISVAWRFSFVMTVLSLEAVFMWFWCMEMCRWHSNLNIKRVHWKYCVMDGQKQILPSKPSERPLSAS